MKGHRLYERFGFNLKDVTESKRTNIKPLFSYYEWNYIIKNIDWINKDTGKALTGYIPIKELIDLLEFNIDFQTE